jgi:PTS system nitrogen regulatory IIA component
MDIRDFLAPADALVDVRAADKAELLHALSRRAAAGLGFDGDRIADCILQREELGSTGMGGGIAIPHARIDDVTRPSGALARLRKAIDFDAIDGRPVDLVFLLLLPKSPGGDQLNALASVARRLRDPEAVLALRQAPDGAALHRAMVEAAVSKPI